MPFEDDRLRIQREKDGTYTAQLPGVWIGRGFPNELEAMEAAEAVVTDRKGSGTLSQRGQFARFQDQYEELLRRQDELKGKMEALAAEMEALAAEMKGGIPDAQAVIDAGYDAIEAFDFDNRYTRKHGRPTLVFVTPWDKDRNGTVEQGEFEFCYGWGRYNMPESEG